MTGRPVDVTAALADRRRYERQIERLHHRHLHTGRLYEIRQDDVTLASVVMHSGRVARALARDVARGRYVLEPGELRTIRVRDKLREVYTCRLTDLIVHGVVAEIVREATAPSLSAAGVLLPPGHVVGRARHTVRRLAAGAPPDRARPAATVASTCCAATSTPTPTRSRCFPAHPCGRCSSTTSVRRCTRWSSTS